MAAEKRRKRIALWCMVLGCAALIFWFSAQTSDESSQISQGLLVRLLSFFAPRELSAAMQVRLGFLEHVLRKIAHFSIYAFSAIWVMLLARSYQQSWGRSLRWTMLAGAIYAMTDEIHQLFVPGRSGQVSDWAIDVCGTLCGALLTMLVAWVVQKVKKKQTNSQND